MWSGWDWEGQRDLLSRGRADEVEIRGQVYYAQMKGEIISG